MSGKATVNVDDGLEDIRGIRPWSRGREVARCLLRFSPKPDKSIFFLPSEGDRDFVTRCYFPSVKTNWRYTDSGLPEPKTNKALLPARLFLPVPPYEHVPFWKGPALEEGTPRVSGEPSRRKNSAHTSPEGPGLRSPARGAPP